MIPFPCSLEHSALHSTAQYNTAPCIQEDATGLISTLLGC